jgi:hypothetical protein
MLNIIYQAKPPFFFVDPKSTGISIGVEPYWLLAINVIFSKFPGYEYL